MSYPFAEIEIQRKGDPIALGLEEGTAPSYVITGASSSAQTGMAFDITVEYASAKEGGGGTANIVLPDIGSGAVANIANNAIVRIKAGYTGDSNAPPKYIFTGRITSFYPTYAQGRGVWVINATAAPETALALFTANSEFEDVETTFRRAFDLISFYPGFTIEAPKSADTLIVAAGWSPAPQFGVAFDLLLNQYRVALEEETGDISNLVYNYNPTDPYNIRIVDMREVEEGIVDYMEYPLFDTSLVFKGGPTQHFEALSDEFDQAVIIEGSDGAVDELLGDATATLEKEFNLTTMFNPNIKHGLIVRAKGNDPIDGTSIDFPFKVNQIRHTLSSQRMDNWRSEFSGPLLSSLTEFQVLD